MIISQFKSNFSSLLVLVTVDAAFNCGVSTVHVEQSVWQHCLKERGKNKVFVSVQGLPLKACFSLGLYPEKIYIFYIPGGYATRNRKIVKISYCYCSYWRGQLCISATSEKTDVSDTNKMAFFILWLAQSGRTGHIYMLILSGNCFWFCFCLLGG